MPSSRTGNDRSRRPTLRVEGLETRLCPADFVAATPAQLRAALQIANTNDQDDTIRLTAATYTFTDRAAEADGGTELGGVALPVLGADPTHTVVINGNGARLLRGTAAATPQMRFFRVAGGKLELDSVSLENGSVDTVFTGGAIFVESGSLEVRNSLLTNNAAPTGGAISYASADDGFLFNSTISGNRSTVGAAGVALTGGDGTTVLNIRNCTIVSNAVSTAAVTGAGLHVFQGVALLENTIVANNTVLGVAGPDIGRTAAATTLFSVRNSLIETGSAAINGSSISNKLNVDPKLGGLLNNGGLTRTHALLAGSQCINTGDSGFLPPSPFDQRGTGFGRVKGIAVDIGAFESALTGLTTLTAPRPSSFVGQAIPFTAQVALANAAAPVPTGLVRFYDGSTLIGVGALDGFGRVTITTAFAGGIGWHAITAVYEGDANYASSRAVLYHYVLAPIQARRFVR